MDLTGKIFGHVTVTGRAPNRGHRVMWHVKCDCGRESDVDGYLLTHHIQDTCGREHAYPEPDDKPETPSGVVAQWIAHGGVWKYQAEAQKAPTDTRDKSARVSVSYYSTIAEAQQAIEDYYQRYDWRPKTVEDMRHDNLREAPKKYIVDGVSTHLFTDKVYSNSTTGFRGVSTYRTKGGELRYRAVIQVNGKQHTMQGFLSAEDAYKGGRLVLEARWLPTGRRKNGNGKI